MKTTLLQVTYAAGPNYTVMFMIIVMTAFEPRFLNGYQSDSVKKVIMNISYFYEYLTIAVC